LFRNGLAADADFEVRAGGAALLDGDPDEPAHAFLVEDGEGVGLDDLLFVFEFLDVWT
jgi:hypothetical protein